MQNNRHDILYYSLKENRCINSGQTFYSDFNKNVITVITIMHSNGGNRSPETLLVKGTVRAGSGLPPNILRQHTPNNNYIHQFHFKHQKTEKPGVRGNGG